MDTETRFNWGTTLRLGLLGAVIALSLAAVGLVTTFDGRDIIGNVVSVGQIFLFGTAFGIGFLLAQQNPDVKPMTKLLGGLVEGLLSSIFLVLVVLMAEPLDLRRFLINVSPALVEILTFGMGPMPGLIILVGASAVIGVVGAGVALLPGKVRGPLVAGLVTVFLVGLLSETIILSWGNQGLGLAIRRVVFAAGGLSILGALIVFVLVAGINSYWGLRGDRVKGRMEALPPARQKAIRWTGIGLGILLLLILPVLLRSYLSEVVNNIGLYIMMGLGLNIVVGFAGLLDLGYVAFYAIGAYAVGILTSTGELGLAGLSFWTALPIAVLIAVAAGIILGVPVLRMRGDYLAIVTLGFGEIIRILATSDFLAPLTGGPQGVLLIPNVPAAGLELIKPEHLYYLILAGCGVAFYVSWRLRDARLGRQWMAVREDEDVAEARGINLVKTKLMAFATGAAFSGLAGAILAPKLNSVFPHSMNLMVSINVLCLIIVGGMGSLPGVIVGALVLIGLPELLREFAEYRLLMYGVLLIIMMLARPEGFWPSETRKRELHADEQMAAVAGSSPAEPGQAG
jgi:branched-chain amino acid transport system permease protein